jgi:hypothetical protein
MSDRRVGRSITGLIFARFSRPRARFVFANTAVITRHEGRQTLRPESKR